MSEFLQESPDAIVGKLSQYAIKLSSSITDLQLNAWKGQVQILQANLSRLPEAHIAFEYVIPRMGKRVDVIVLYAGRVFVLEFKVGEGNYPAAALEQALDYALDLKNFHAESHEREIVPVLVATNAKEIPQTISKFGDGVFQPLKCNADNYLDSIWVLNQQEGDFVPPVDANEWLKSMYQPTPTIVEAAQALYAGHSVKDITRSSAKKINLTITANAISEVIEGAKGRGHKAICFVTGVPGSGKTLAGLNVASQRSDAKEGEHAVFLSGNGPLVTVLQEALTRDKVQSAKEQGHSIRKSDAKAQTKTFIQNIHHFRDEYIKDTRAPSDRIVIFDEAQRAWTKEQTSKFMAQKKGIADFNQSEPEYLISVMDRHQDWAVIICLVGGGQEINTGEAGLTEWFTALKEKFPQWKVFVSDRLADPVYTNGENIYAGFTSGQLTYEEDLHLDVAVRSYRSERLSEFVGKLLDCDVGAARTIYSEIRDDYPIFVTRNADAAREWLREKARGSEGRGIVASSGGYRLRPYGIDVKRTIDPAAWFLNDSDDIRSSDFLEDVGTEFDVQGLELDWTCVAWDANLRKTADGWEYRRFSGTKWQQLKKMEAQRYLLNSYRVLLTRARQGMIIFVPEGDERDQTRLPEFYDPVFEYFVSLGIRSI